MLACCTYFDSRYLTRAIALYRSLERQNVPFRLWMLCFDDEGLTMLRKLKLPYAVPVSNQQLQAHSPKLREAQSNRSLYEYYVTIKPFLIRWIFDHDADADPVFLFDADFYFYANPQLLREEMGAAAVLLTPHRLTPLPTSAKARQHGTFNAGFVAFGKSAGGLAPLTWWSDRVLEWCGDRPKGELFADQGYLDPMMRQFSDVRAARHPGMNAAPWNIDERNITETDRGLLTGNLPLIFFHFHGLRRLGPRLYDTGTAPYRLQPSKTVSRRIFAPYIRELRTVDRWLRSEFGFRPAEGSVRHPLPRIFASPGLLLSRIMRRQWMIA